MTNDGVLRDVEYFRIADAAEKLHCSTHHLLHLGAIGKAELSAPVFSEGDYEWPVSAIGEAYPSTEPSFRTNFDVCDRVILLAKDLKRIEAVGWTTPKIFFAPSRGLEIAAHWRGTAFFEQANDEGLTHELIMWRKIYYPDPGASNQPARTKRAQRESFARMQECAMSVPWYAAKPMPEWGRAEEDDEGSVDVQRDAAFLKTTIEHLFVSKNELNRLAANAPQDGAALNRQQTDTKSKKVHGNAERYSNVRAQVLLFAIYCKEKWSEQCANTATQWAEVIDERAPLQWESGRPPLSRVEIEKLLREALTIGDKKK